MYMSCVLCAGVLVICTWGVLACAWMYDVLYIWIVYMGVWMWMFLHGCVCTILCANCVHVTACQLCVCDCVDMYRKHVSCMHVSMLVHVCLVLWVWRHTSNLQGSSLEISGVMAFVTLHQPWFGRTLMLQVHIWKWVMFLQKRGNLCAWLHGDCVILPHDTCGHWTPLDRRGR